MLKKLKRISKNSFKFQFVISYQELTLDCFNDWLPSEVCVLLSRKRRRILTEKHPFVADPLKPDRFTLMWMIPEDVVAKVTMYKDGRRNSFDDKEWTLSVVQNDFVLASSKLNLKNYASIESRHSTTTIYLKPQIDSITMAYLIVTISCGLALSGNSNEDSQSLASSISSCNQDEEQDEEGADVAILSDFVSFPTMGESNLNWFTNGMQEFNHFDDEREVIGNCDTSKIREVSIPSLKYDFQTMDRILQSPGPAESLMEWCIRITEGYPCVEVKNMTTSFRDGMAFCAIINHHRPDLINFEILSTSNIKENNEIAFKAAEKLGIRSPFNSNDMLAIKIPDKLSVLTFLHQLRQYFLHSKTINSYYHMNNHNSTFEANALKKGSPINALNQHFNKNYLSRSMSPPSSIASPISGYERKNFLNPFDSDEEELDSRCSTYIEANNAPNYSSGNHDKLRYIDLNITSEGSNYSRSNLGTNEASSDLLDIRKYSLPYFEKGSNNINYVSCQNDLSGNMNMSANDSFIDQSHGIVNDNKYIFPTKNLDYPYDDYNNVQLQDVNSPQDVVAKVKSFINQNAPENTNCIKGLDANTIALIKNDDFKIQKGTEEIIELLGDLSELIDQEQINSCKRNNDNKIVNNIENYKNNSAFSKINNNSLSINIEKYKQRAQSDIVEPNNSSIIMEQKSNLDNMNTTQLSFNIEGNKAKVNSDESDSPNLLHKMMHLTFIDDIDNAPSEFLSSHNKQAYRIPSELNNSKDSLNNIDAMNDNCNLESNLESYYTNKIVNGNSLETQTFSLDNEKDLKKKSDKENFLEDLKTSKEINRDKTSRKKKKVPTATRR